MNAKILVRGFRGLIFCKTVKKKYFEKVSELNT